MRFGEAAKIAERSKNTLIVHRYTGTYITLRPDGTATIAVGWDYAEYHEIISPIHTTDVAVQAVLEKHGLHDTQWQIPISYQRSDAPNTGGKLDPQIRQVTWQRPKVPAVMVNCPPKPPMGLLRRLLPWVGWLA